MSKVTDEEKKLINADYSGKKQKHISKSVKYKKEPLLFVNNKNSWDLDSESFPSKFFSRFFFNPEIKDFVIKQGHYSDDIREMQLYLFQEKAPRKIIEDIEEILGEYRKKEGFEKIR